MKFSLFIILSLCLSLTFGQQSRSGFNTVIAALREFQNPDGGFYADKSQVSSLEATHHAMFLSSLFGMRDRIDSAAAAKFLDAVKNADGGFSDSVGQPSSLSAVRHALSVHGYLGLTDIDKSAVTAFVKSHLDDQTKLFFDKVGGRPSIQATATAFQIFSLLGASQRDFVVKAAADVETYLKAHTKGYSFVFPEENLDELAANYFGILAGSLVGYKFEDPSSWAGFFTLRQSKSHGGFHATFTDNASHSLKATFQGVSAVYYLSKATGVDVKSAVDTRALAQYLRGIPHDLTAAALAHSAVSRTTLFPELFQKQATYEVLNGDIEGDTIIVGTQLKPVLSVKTFYGLPHAGLSAEAVLTHKSIGEKKVPLRWNQEAQHYVADEFFDSADKLGPLTAKFNVRINLVGEAVEFFMNDEKHIGYSIKVTPSAKSGEKDISPNGVVAAGTHFNFGVALSTGKTKITQGDFDLVFSVLDSSEVVLHTETKNGRGNTGALSFSYDLASVNFPAGALLFRFQVKNADGVHTSHLVAYGVAVRTVASEISYQASQDYKIGDTVTVTMKPASLPEANTVNLFSYTDAAGNAAIGRTFFLDVYALNGETAVRNIKGTASNSNGNVLYTFEYPVTASFLSIGTHRFSFRYVPQRGNRDLTLGNFDSKTNELLDETQPLTFAVKADLQVTELSTPPKDGSLSYGNDISFTFKVLDAISGKFIWTEGETDVALNLKNVDSKGKTYVSDKVYATQTFDKTGAKSALAISWSVSPNAVKGAGTLGLTAEIAGGEEVALVKATDKKPWSVSVTIGGTIVATHEVQTLSTPDGTHNVFLVTFELNCQGKSLRGAQLRGVVTEMGGVSVSDFVVPVARQADTGIYSVSWVASDEQAQSGRYTIQIFREVDKEGEPLFSVSFDFTALHSNFLPFRTETFVLALAIVGLGFFSVKKFHIENRK